MIPDSRSTQPGDGPMQCGNQPEVINVIHHRSALRPSCSPSGATHTRSSTAWRKIASDTLSPVDTCRPYQLRRRTETHRRLQVRPFRRH
jgi:hypothetical protein